MKPTDEERRAVAKRLRNNADQNRRWVVPWAVFNDADEHGDIEVHNRLADLIEPEPKRYCRWIWGEEWLESTPENPRELQWANWYPDCGCWDGCEPELAKFDDPDDEPIKWEYCPHCGRKVVIE